MSMPDIMLIDPTFYGGILTVPFSKTLETKGRADWLRGALRKELSLCCLYQNGKCHAGSKCFQVHADRSFVAELRQQLAHVKSCCEHCGDTATHTGGGAAFFAKLRESRVERVSVAGATLPLGKVAYTTGLVSTLQAIAPLGVVVEIPVQRICRLHLKSRCKYGKDCKNVHLCSLLGEQVLSGEISPAAIAHEHHTPAKSRSPATAGNSCATSPPLSPGLSFVTSPVTPQPLPLDVLPQPQHRALEQHLLNARTESPAHSASSKHSFGDDLDDAKDPLDGMLNLSSMNFDASKCILDDSLFKFSNAANADAFHCPCSASLVQKQFW